MDQIYRQQILDHYQNPQNFGALENATHSATLENLSCGDKITIHTCIENDQISDISFEGEGCAICIASASLLTEEVLSKSTDTVANMTYDSIQDYLGITLSPSRIKCAHLALLTLQEALK
ncbi:iron-sulfur cluster assembly scaffold protein [Candidatus Dojkabacteria bacterium]|uniref:Iron-sulfur cluster assembly scaffold protein n=1 Tax=Candidatus Dojkabacteria bacterium TaxID=2099670 RepID=A0A955L6Z6_9BACT|nr:iron-sulfur cluster assembly scaffold protein [Candidatus Dojkabacteria bacterium]